MLCIWCFSLKVHCWTSGYEVQQQSRAYIVFIPHLDDFGVGGEHQVQRVVEVKGSDGQPIVMIFNQQRTWRTKIVDENLRTRHSLKSKWALLVIQHWKSEEFTDLNWAISSMWERKMTCPVLVPTAMPRESLNFSALMDGRPSTLQTWEKHIRMRLLLMLFDWY